MERAGVDKKTMIRTGVRWFLTCSHQKELKDPVNTDGKKYSIFICIDPFQNTASPFIVKAQYYLFLGFNPKILFTFITTQQLK